MFHDLLLMYVPKGDGDIGGIFFILYTRESTDATGLCSSPCIKYMHGCVVCIGGVDNICFFFVMSYYIV